jgi:hypothetical protein
VKVLVIATPVAIMVAVTKSIVKEWCSLPPGAVYHNHSCQPHTMQTLESQLLTMGFYRPPYGWEGGLLDAEAL